MFTASPIDSPVFSGLFSTEKMREIWTDRTRVQCYLEVELALAHVQARLGIIPQDAATEIGRHGNAADYDLEALGAATVRAGTPIIPVVNALVAKCADGAGEWAHWGATTQDIMDTGMVLQIRAALALIEADLAAICAGLAELARTHRDVPMAGRSNLQHAIPVTFGYKAAVLLSSFQRHRERLAQLRPRILVGQFGGAVGTLASLGDQGLAVQTALMAELHLGQPVIAWHTVRDTLAEAGQFLALLTATCAKFALDVRLLMQTEVGEAFEPAQAGRGGSSTMPQKRNPVAGNFVHACAALVRNLSATLVEAMVQDHERATGPFQMEWAAVPEIFCLAAGALSHARLLAEGLRIDAARMRTNLDATGGLVLAEAVMMGLGAKLGRSHAHHLVQDICKQVIAGQGSFLDLLAANPEIAAVMDRDALAALLDPANYTGLSGLMVDRVLGVEA
jgi:3-carboxy-cis,cis-muconate cycloisomerase